MGQHLSDEVFDLLLSCGHVNLDQRLDQRLKARLKFIGQMLFLSISSQEVPEMSFRL